MCGYPYAHKLKRDYNVLFMTNFIPEIILFRINPNKCHMASIPNQMSMSVYYAHYYGKSTLEGICLVAEQVTPPAEVDRGVPNPPQGSTAIIIISIILKCIIVTTDNVWDKKR